MMLINLQIETYGKVSKYGENVYKVGSGAALLEKNGWQIVKRPSGNSSYYYMKAPVTQRSKSFTIQVEVPADHELFAFAEELHERGEAYKGTFQGWPVIYTPRRISPPSTMQVIFDGKIMLKPVPASEESAWFECGTYADGWSYYVRFETPVRVHKSEDII
jgi:hypothetical protein